MSESPKYLTLLDLEIEHFLWKMRLQHIEKLLPENRLFGGGIPNALIFEWKRCITEKDGWAFQIKCRKFKNYMDSHLGSSE